MHKADQWNWAIITVIVLMGIPFSAFAFDQVNLEGRLRDQFPNTEQPGMSYYITYASSEFFNE